MSITLFNGVNCSGSKSVSITKDTPDLTANEFLQVAMSLTVSGDEPWVVYSGKNYQGEYKLYRPGNVPDLGELSNSISSVRVVHHGLGSSRIMLFDDISFGGQPLTLTEATAKLSSCGLKNMPASLKVTKGAWQLFSQDNFGGDSVPVLCGDELGNLQSIGWYRKTCSLKPYSA